MPAHLTGLAAIGLKAVTFFPRNEGTELDSHQGAVLLFESGRGRLLAMIDATSSPRCGPQRSAGSPRGFSPGRTPATSRSWARASRPARTSRRCWPCGGSGESASPARPPSAPVSFAEREAKRHSISELTPCNSVEAAVAGRHRLHGHVFARALVPGSGSARARTSTPSAPASRPRASSTRRDPKRSRLFVDQPRRRPRRGGRPPAADPDGAMSDEHIVAELGELVTGAAKGRTPPPTSRSSSPWASRSRTSPPRTTSTARPAAPVSESGGVRRRPPRRRLSARDSTTSAPARARIAAIGPPDPAPPAARRRALRDLPEAREPSADRLLQAPRRRNAMALPLRRLSPAGSTRRAPATWRRAWRGMPAGSASRARSWCPTPPRTKLAAIERLGARIVKVPYERWWQVLVEHRYPGIEGLFSTPSPTARSRRQRHDRARDPGGSARRGHRARAVRGRRSLVRNRLGLTALRPATRVLACEVETAAPFTRRGPRAARSTAYHPSFVDGIGARSVLPEMWPLASALLAGSVVVSLEETASAIRLLAERVGSSRKARARSPSPPRRR